jgi:hypothetical protein
MFRYAGGKQEQTYYLTDGKWYCVETSYLAKIKNTLDPLCVDLLLPAFVHGDRRDAAQENSHCCWTIRWEAAQ